ncbi:MAG: dolichol kinase [Armatimonadetes bacterium]|nr:dolichol kinase [Armatimonadota bacterium]
MADDSATAQPTQITMRGEFVRKGIHLCSMSVPLIYHHLTRGEMLLLLIPAALLALVIDILRFRSAAFDAWFGRLFGAILRPHEQASKKRKMNGATFVLVSAALCVALFPKVIAITAFTVLIISDTAGALIGRPFGRHKFLEKSLEGSLAFVVTAIGVVLIAAQVYQAPASFIYVGILCSVAAAIAEAMSYGINVDDNFTIPLTFGLLMWGLLAAIGGTEVAAIVAY